MTAQLRKIFIALAGTYGKSLRRKVLGVQVQPSLVKPGTFEAIYETHAGSQSAGKRL